MSDNDMYTSIKVSNETALEIGSTLGVVTEEMVQLALHTILRDRKSYNTTLNYAVNYVRHATGCTGEELRVQCLYVLNNIPSWRNPQAKDVRKVLKGFCGIKR
jgi:hypothetical protein